MTEQRLPRVSSDDGIWGDILNLFLSKEHYNDNTDNVVNGGHKTITIRAGTATALTAPLKFTSGTVLTTPEVGAVEFLTNRLYYTQTTGPTRLTVLAVDDSLGVVGDMYYRAAGAGSSADLVRLPIGTTGQVLTSLGTTLVPTWATPSGGGSGLTQQQVMGITSMRI